MVGALRPLDLPEVSLTPVSGLPPVPQDEWGGGSTPRRQSKVIRGGPEKSLEARSFESGSFKTPPSSVEKEQGTRTEGPQPEVGGAASSQPELERALEEEMFLQPWKENKALKDELAACKKREHGQSSSWSAISSTGQLGTPRRKSTDGGSLRYTPGWDTSGRNPRSRPLYLRFLRSMVESPMRRLPRHV